MHRLTLLALQEAGADVARQELEGHEVGLAERLPIDRIGDVQHAARLVVDEDRHGQEGRGAVAAGLGALPSAVAGPHQQRALRGGHRPGDALAGVDAHLFFHPIGHADGVRDDEVGRPFVTQQERRPLSADKLGRDLEDRVQKIFRKPSRAHGPYGVHHCSPYARSPECPVAD